MIILKIHRSSLAVFHISYEYLFYVISLRIVKFHFLECSTVVKVIDVSYFVNSLYSISLDVFTAGQTEIFSYFNLIRINSKLIVQSSAIHF